MVLARVAGCLVETGKSIQDFALHRSRSDRLYYRTAVLDECVSECPTMTDWEAVVGQHVEIVRRTVYRLVGNDADAWDCVQETFLEAVRIDRREPVRDWSALLRHLATARALDLLRMRSRQRCRCSAEADPAQATSREPSPSHQAEASELADRLRAAVGQLPRRQAQVFCLTCFEQMTSDEVGHRLGISPTAARMLLSRAPASAWAYRALASRGGKGRLRTRKMENHENFHHDELLERAVEAVLRDPIPDELPSDRVAQLAAVVRQAALEPHPITLIERITRSLDTWRWIMRSPVSRVAAAAVFILAIAGVALWFHAGGTQYAFADFFKPILEAKSAKFKATFEHNGKQAATANVMVSAPNRARMELQRPGQPVEITIVDYSKGVSVMIDSAKKIAVINKMVGLPRERASMNLLEELQSLIRDAKKPDVKRESLGKKEVDGHRAVGWRLSGPGLHEPGVTATIWGDLQTGLPIRIESSYALTGQKSTLSDCIWNPDLDESMFNCDPPVGYKVVNIQTDLSPVTETDLTKTLRRCGEVFGVFPDTLNRQAIFEMVKRLPKKDGHKIGDLFPLAHARLWICGRTATESGPPLRGQRSFAR